MIIALAWDADSLCSQEKQPPMPKAQALRLARKLVSGRFCENGLPGR